MGFKRPFDEEEFQEFTLKHPKQVDCGNKLTSFSESYPCYGPTQKAEIPGEEIFCKFRLGDGLEHDSRNVVLDLVDKEFETTPLSLVTRSTSDEDAGSAATVCSSLYPEYFEFYIPRRPLVQFGDSYSSLFEGPPRIQVAIGPNHQAEVPVWNPNTMETYSSGSDNVGDAYGGELMGNCVFPMLDPELSADSGVNAGDGRKDCLCPDQGSVRCVRQHIREARERVREILGYEKFVLLGFCDMGEEVSLKWTEEEEVIFRDVVYSNPVSRGKNFWEHLSMVFPSRTKNEIVSYYFNVFMLRRRAIQNRSHVLDIDSDDDEWNGSNEGPFGVVHEDEETAIECLVNQHAQLDYEDDSPDDDDCDGDEDDYEGDADDHEGDCDAGKGGGHTVENDGGRSRIAQIGMSLKDCRSEFVVHPASKISGCDGVNFDAQNLSGVSFEGQPNVVDSFGSSDARAAAQDSGVKCDHKDGDLYGNDDGLVAGYLSESCDAKDWGFPINSLKGVDLLSTGNMIEEIFGPATKSSNGKSSS